jgi:threonine/homoserine/homoserine lactone efflux protein
MFSLLLKGMLVGFSIAMPFGAIDLLCIRNSLSWGKRYGFMTGMGAATADAIFGAIAGFGVAALTAWLASYHIFFQIIGGLFLCYLGFTIFCSKPHAGAEEKNRSKSMIKMFLTTFFLVMTNPLTILSFIGIFAGLGIGIEQGSLSTSLILAMGVFLGSALWWLILTNGASLFKNKINQQGLHWLNRISGALLMVIGIGVLLLLT